MRGASKQALCTAHRSLPQQIVFGTHNTPFELVWHGGVPTSNGPIPRDQHDRARGRRRSGPSCHRTIQVRCARTLSLLQRPGTPAAGPAGCRCSTWYEHLDILVHAGHLPHVFNCAHGLPRSVRLLSMLPNGLLESHYGRRIVAGALFFAILAVFHGCC